MPDVIVVGVRDESPDTVLALDRHLQVTRASIDLDRSDRPAEERRADRCVDLLKFLGCRAVVARPLSLPRAGDDPCGCGDVPGRFEPERQPLPVTWLALDVEQERIARESDKGNAAPDQFAAEALELLDSVHDTP